MKVVHYYSDDQRVTREHIVYMPQSEYDTSGSRYKNQRWVEDKLKDKLGERYDQGSYILNGGVKEYIKRGYNEIKDQRYDRYRVYCSYETFGYLHRLQGGQECTE